MLVTLIQMLVFAFGGFPGGSGVKNPPLSAGSLDSEGPLEEDMAAYSSVPAWRIPWTAEPGGLQSMESQRVRCD